ncbi:unnamed protein product [Protopolystoma xenopodis]|uniref:Uncharacterized protein n=1 Tax=Protopolystoma xenopodis TaxID=117903 RepID=A0A3S5CGL0_9PLAT|nr:unnamed protein product [Protopolystoma xenopodis]
MSRVTRRTGRRIKAKRLQHNGIHPSSSDTPMANREALFLEKLRFCCRIFDFSVSQKQLKLLELKRLTLIELADYLSSQDFTLTEPMYNEIIRMFTVNAIRYLPPLAVTKFGPEDNDPEMAEDEEYSNPSWPYLQARI